MGNRLLFIPGMIVMLLLVSFTFRSIPANVAIGTYGVCDCEETTSVKFNLTLGEDFTFHYYKNDDPAHVTDVRGKWEAEGNSILLKDYDASNPIHDKWTLDKNDTCLKSRKGLEWTRLCRVKTCK